MHLVKATREGLLGQRTASGLIIDKDGKPLTADDWFCALPCRKTLGKIVRIINPATADEVTAPQLDVGPWNTDDDAYVLGTARPAAEAGASVSGQGTNGAGIDLSDGVWRALRMTDNGPVLWEFVR